MSLDTNQLHLNYQIIDLASWLSAAVAREIIEDHLNNAMVPGDNLYITYTDIPPPGIVELGTTDDVTFSGTVGLTLRTGASVNRISNDADMSANSATSLVTEFAAKGYVDNYALLRDGTNNLTGDWDFGSFTISGTGDIHCDDLYTSGTTIHIGDYIELTDTGSALATNTPLQVGSGGATPKLIFDGATAYVGLVSDQTLMTLTSGVAEFAGDVIVGGNIGTPNMMDAIQFDETGNLGSHNAHMLVASGITMELQGPIWFAPTYWDDARVPGLQTSLLGTRDPDLLMFKHTGSSYGVWAYHFDPDSIEEYIARDGYSAFFHALYKLEPSEIVSSIKKSGLRGRGGGGFPAGIKWETCAKQDGERYI